MRKRYKYPLIVIVLLVVFGTLFTFSILTATLTKPVTMQLNMPDKTDADTVTSKLKDTIKIIVIGNSEVYFESNANGEKVLQLLILLI